MGRIHRFVDSSLRCSFCSKSQELVGKLKGSPRDTQRAYICDECISVCAAILEDDAGDADTSLIDDVTESGSSNPLLLHPLASALMEALERWIAEESVGADVALALNKVRGITAAMMADTRRNSDG